MSNLEVYLVKELYEERDGPEGKKEYLTEWQDGKRRKNRQSAKVHEKKTWRTLESFEGDPAMDFVKKRIHELFVEKKPPKGIVAHLVMKERDNDVENHSVKHYLRNKYKNQKFSEFYKELRDAGITWDEPVRNENTNRKSTIKAKAKGERSSTRLAARTVGTDSGEQNPTGKDEHEHDMETSKDDGEPEDEDCDDEGDGDTDQDEDDSDSDEEDGAPADAKNEAMNDDVMEGDREAVSRRISADGSEGNGGETPPLVAGDGEAEPRTIETDANEANDGETASSSRQPVIASKRKSSNVNDGPEKEPKKKKDSESDDEDSGNGDNRRDDKKDKSTAARCNDPRHRNYDRDVHTARHMAAIQLQRADANEALYAKAEKDLASKILDNLAFAEKKNSELAEMRAHNTALTKQCDSLRAAEKTAVADTQKVSKQKQSLEKKNGDLEKKTNDLETRRVSRTTNEQLTRDLKSSNDKLREAEGLANSARLETDDMRSQLTAKTNELEASKTARVKIAEEKADMETQLREASGEIKRLTEQIEKMKQTRKQKAAQWNRDRKSILDLIPEEKESESEDEEEGEAEENDKGGDKKDEDGHEGGDKDRGGDGATNGSGAPSVDDDPMGDDSRGVNGNEGPGGSKAGNSGASGPPSKRARVADLALSIAAAPQNTLGSIEEPEQSDCELPSLAAVPSDEAAAAAVPPQNGLFSDKLPNYGEGTEIVGGQIVLRLETAVNSKTAHALHKFSLMAPLKGRYSDLSTDFTAEDIMTNCEDIFDDSFVSIRSCGPVAPKAVDLSPKIRPIQVDTFDEEADSAQLRLDCDTDTIANINGLIRACGIVVGQFKNDVIRDADANATIDIRVQSKQPSGSWKFISEKLPASDEWTLKRCVAYQNDFEQGEKEIEEDRCAKKRGKKTDYEISKAKGVIYFPTNIEMADCEKWRPQQNEVNKLPKDLRVSGDGTSNMLDHVMHVMYGVNRAQIYLKVSGNRTPAHMENVCLASVNLNLGPGECRWYAVPYEYWGEINKLCLKKNKKVDFLNGSWWPNEDELRENGIPVTISIQKAGGVMRIAPGCIHWVEATGVCTNVAWNVASLNHRQLTIAIHQNEWNREVKYKSVVPMQLLLWKVAKHMPIKEEKLYNLVKGALMRSLANCRKIVNYAEDNNIPVVATKWKEEEGVHFCNNCKGELFCIYFQKKDIGHCAQCIEESLEGYFCMQQIPFEDLSTIFNNFKLRS